MTLANWVWLEAQTSTNDIARQSATVAGQAKLKAPETISAAGPVMSGRELGARMETPPTSQYFFPQEKEEEWS